MLCAVLTDDLMFSQMVANALPADASIRPVRDPSRLEDSVDDKVDVILVDLSIQIDFAKLSTIAQSVDARLIGIASHVYRHKIEKAKQSGFDVVLTRGQTASELANAVAR